MKKLLVAASVAALMGTATTASAESWYVFGDVGQSDYDLGAPGTGFTVDETDTMYNIGLGYRFNENFAVEVGYTDLGEASIATTAPVSGTLFGSNFSADGRADIETDGFFLGLRGDLPVSDSVNLFAKAGLINWESDVTFTGTFTLGADSFSGTAGAELADGTDPYFGFGADWKLSENFAINAQYTMYKLDVDGEDLDIDGLTVGLSYAF